MHFNATTVAFRSVISSISQQKTFWTTIHGNRTKSQFYFTKQAVTSVSRENVAKKYLKQSFSMICYHKLRWKFQGLLMLKFTFHLCKWIRLMKILWVNHCCKFFTEQCHLKKTIFEGRLWSSEVAVNNTKLQRAEQNAPLWGKQILCRIEKENASKK